MIYAIAVLFGLVFGWLDLPVLNQGAEVVSEIFMNLLKLVSLPIIFLSLVSTASSMESLEEISDLGKRTIRYTFLTTLIASSVALFLFVTLNPVGSTMIEQGNWNPDNKSSYFTHLIHLIPSNIVAPFAENNVMSVLFLALLFSLALLTLPTAQRHVLHAFFKALFGVIMKITSWIVWVMPLAITAFIVLFMDQLKGGLPFEQLALYLAVVLLANLIQGFIILPALLKFKGLSPWKLAKAMYPALSVAFFSKSSAGALPAAMRCAQDRAGISSRVAGFSLPLCTTINMNGCAAFILSTVLFVSMSHGMTYSPLELLAWIFLATLAAVGNAGVPMGCFFLSTAFLAAMDIPVTLMGIILPFYSLIDMVETALNVWSDSSVTAIVDHEVKAHDAPQRQSV